MQRSFRVMQQLMNNLFSPRSGSFQSRTEICMFTLALKFVSISVTKNIRLSLHRKLKERCLKKKFIPVNTIADHFDAGIAIERIYFSTSEEATLNSSEEAKRSHREDLHSFFLIEKGAVYIEIDFQEYKIVAQSVI